MDGFKVLSEFRFDVGNAVVNSEKLQGAVDKISDAANQANFAFEKFSTGLVGQFNLLNFSVFNILKSALDVTNSFEESTKSFATTMATNMNYLQGPIGSFNDKLAVSRNLMDEMIVRAGRIGISPTAMVKATHEISASLIPAGLAGNNLGNAQNLGALGVQAAKPLGMDAASIGKQIGNLVVGKDVGGSLMNALIGSSKTFQQFKGSVEDFTNLSGPERIKTLTIGLKELQAAVGATGNEIITFSDVTDKLKDMFYGLGSVLKPIGDVIFPVVLRLISDFASKVQEFAPRIGKEIGGMLQDIMKDPKEVITNLMSLKHIGGDFKIAKDIVGFITVLDLLVMGLKKIGILKGGLTKIILSFVGESLFAGLKGALSGIAGLFSFSGIASIGRLIMFGARAIWWSLGVLKVIFIDLLFPIAFLISVFQAFHKALAIVQFEKTVAMIKSLPAMVEGFHKIETAVMKILAPFIDFVDVMSKLIASMILAVSGADSWVHLTEMVANGLDMLGDAVIILMTGLHGVVAGIIQLIGDLVNMNFKGIGGRIKSAANDSMDDYLNKHLKGVDNGKNVSNQITNIGKVEIKNDFKDNVEPDRIAFTMKDQLLKAAQNRTQSRGRSLQTSFAK